jgi:hypothetical protein
MGIFQIFLNPAPFWSRPFPERENGTIPRHLSVQLNRSKLACGSVRFFRQLVQYFEELRCLPNK